ncbi:excinuclease ABC subunit C [archaeon]|nr:excinuclease ABC subunit C [archaeon]MBT6182373.1 excinuclease ABC subunit C [archaeon]MBT6606538.1 excinuclease ABC subunit C [archaeon]MBT7251835.1 excinuclease ABC subunit C [archaeon]MBT7661097.1 excinuclease ABC subunit C [archaeon]
MIDLTKLPKNPGCYLFKDINGTILYIGKAKVLAKRVRSYFNKNHDDSKTNILVSKIDSVEFFVTDSEIEALILENNLIKKHSPKYNIDLKDSKRYAYIELTAEEFPRFLIARKPDLKSGSKYFGPFVSAASRDHILEAVRRIFRIRTCKKLPKRACLRHSIGLCSAPCTGAISKKDYLNDVASAKMVLEGKNKELTKHLKKRMEKLSKAQNYELAMEVREQIGSLDYLSERQKMERQKHYDEDIINYVAVGETIHLMLFNSRKGILENKQEFELEKTPHFLEEFLVSFYSKEKTVPREIIVPKLIDEKIEKYLSSFRRFWNVKITVPKQGEKKELLDLVLKNLEIGLFGNREKIEDLMNSLKLNELPKVIECFDISHLSGTSTVASMVQFRNGVADKSNYRKYKIRTVHQIDDFASMKEVVSRRYSKLQRENLDMPNLIVVDGGKGQLSSTIEVMEELGLKVPVISLAKREEEVFIPGRVSPILLDKRGKALKLLQEIRDEAHRFAIAYNRLLRRKKVRE